MLRRLNPELDGPALHAIFGDEEACRYLPRPAFTSLEETTAQLKAWSPPGEAYNWAIVDDSEGPALGRVALIPRGAEVFEIAVMVCPQAAGRGLATGAVREAVDRAFAEGARRVFADIDPENYPSIRVCEKVGFRQEGRLRATWRTHLGVRDSIIMGLLPEDPRPAAR